MALTRAWLFAPDLLVLDEATSAVDAALEVRLRRAIEQVTGRQDKPHGRPTGYRPRKPPSACSCSPTDGLVEDGPHRALLAAVGTYAALHADWEAGTAEQHSG